MSIQLISNTNLTGSLNITGSLTLNGSTVSTGSGGGAGFPYTGSAEITGSLGVTGSISTPIVQLTQTNGTASFGYTGSIVLMDCSKSNNFELVLTSPSASLLDAINFKPGQEISLKVYQSSSTLLEPTKTNLQLPPDIFISPSGSGRYLAPITLGQIDQINFTAYSTSSLQAYWNENFITQSLVATGIPTANLTVWFKPENFTTSSGRITGWTDASGLSNNATQVTPTSRPYYSGSALNGYPAATFKGNTEANWLDYPNDIWDTGTGSNATTLFAVVRPNTATGGNYGAIIAQGQTNRASVAVCPQAFPDATIKWATNNYASGGRKTTGNSATGSFYYVTWQWTDWQNRDTTTIRINGSDAASANWDATPLAVGTGNRYIGTFIDINANSTVDGDICEIIVYRASLSTADRNQVESYLATKYGL